MLIIKDISILLLKNKEWKLCCRASSLSNFVVIDKKIDLCLRMIKLIHENLTEKGYDNNLTLNYTSVNIFFKSKIKTNIVNSKFSPLMLSHLICPRLSSRANH